MLFRTYMAAQMVENILEARLQETETTVLSAPYWNMREKGFFFYRLGYEPYPTYVYVCEGRSTDQIMVTVSDSMGWDRVTDTEYAAARYFAPDNYDSAATYVLEQLSIFEKV